MAEVGDNQARQNTERQVEEVEHAGQNNPEKQHHNKCSKFSFHYLSLIVPVKKN